MNDPLMTVENLQDELDDAYLEILTLNEIAVECRRLHRLVLDLGDVLAGERPLDDELGERLTKEMIRATAVLREAI